MKTIYKHTGERVKNPGLLFWVFYVALMILFVLLSLTAKAQFDPFTQITDDDIPQYSPAIDGDYIVYEDLQFGTGSHIYLYNIATGETKLLSSDPGASPRNADISGNRVVWEERHDDQWDIYMYDISRPDLGSFPLIDFPGDQDQPAIHENTLVYVDHFGNEFSANLYMYDFDTHDLVQITDDSEHQQANPDVYRHYIVYETGGDIFLYNTYTKEKIQLTDDPGYQCNPTIYGNRVIWQDNRDGNWNLYMHCILFMPGTPFENYDWPIKTGPGNSISDSDEINPQIWGDYIVYQDNRNGNWDIFLFNFYTTLSGKAFPLVTETKGQIDPAISDNRIVWADERDDNLPHYEADIWMWTRPPGADLGVSITDLPDPVKAGDELTYKIYVKNFGVEDATNVVLKDIISDKVEFLRASGAKSGGCPRAGNTITCNIGKLANGETDTVTVVVKAVTEGLAMNTANVTATEDDPIPENNNATVSTTVQWDVPHALSEGYYPALAIDDSGNAHITYLSDDGLIYINNKSGRWFADTITSSQDAGSHAIAIDPGGHVHIAWVDNKNILYINDTAGVWSSPAVIYDNCRFCGSIDLKIDKDMYFHIGFLKGAFSSDYMYTTNKSPLSTVWDCYMSGAMDVNTAGYAYFSYYVPGAGIVYRTNSPDGKWGNPEVVDFNWSGIQLESLVTDIAVDKEGRPHISFVSSEAGNGGEDTWYAYRTDNGWKNVFIDDGEIAGSFNAIATDKNNKTHIIYYHSKTDEIRYAENTQGNWVKHTISVNAGGDPYSTRCDITTDSAGYVHMVYEDRGQIVYITNRPAPPPPKEPDIYVSPLNIDFGKKHVGHVSETKKVTIRNSGEVTLHITDISLIWPDSIHFTITNNTCNVLAPADTCSVTMAFIPKARGDQRARLKIGSDDPDEPEVLVSLRGIGVAPTMRHYGNTAFGTVQIGDSAVHDYIIKNIGDAHMTVQLVKIEEGDADEFYLAGLPSLPFGIDENDSVTFQIIFKPDSEGEKSTKLKIFSNASNPEIELTGESVPPYYTVSGEIIIDQNTPVNYGWVLVHRLNPDNKGWRTQNYHLEGDNQFSISMREGEVTVYVFPDEEKYPGYLKTYLGNTAVFDQARFFYLNHDTTGIKIRLVPAPPPPDGTGTVSGILVESEEGGKTADGPCGSGSPVDSVNVFLYDTSGNLITYTTTSATGEFIFENVPAGNYLFKADYTGYKMDPGNEILSVSGDNQKFHVCAKVENTLITVEITKVTGIENPGGTDAVRIYPNPAGDELTVSLPRSMEAENMSLRIYTINGKIVQYKDLIINDKQSTMVVKVSDLPPGMYILSIEGELVNFRERFMKY